MSNLVGVFEWILKAGRAGRMLGQAHGGGGGGKRWGPGLGEV